MRLEAGKHPQDMRRAAAEVAFEIVGEAAGDRPARDAADSRLPALACEAAVLQEEE